MIKKVICLGVVLVMCLAAFTGCNQKLEKDLSMKETRIAELESERREFFGISKETEDQIKQDYLEKLNDSNITIEDIYIYRYFGIYNESVAVIMALYGISPPPSIDEIVVEGFEFSFNTGRHISIWKSNVFYSLQNAYDESILIIDDLEKIHDLH